MIAEIEQSIIGLRNLERSVDNLVGEIKYLQEVNKKLLEENTKLKEQINDKHDSNSKESK